MLQSIDDSYISLSLSVIDMNVGLLGGRLEKLEMSNLYDHSPFVSFCSPSRFQILHYLQMLFAHHVKRRENSEVDRSCIEVLFPFSLPGMHTHFSGMLRKYTDCFYLVSLIQSLIA